MKTTQLIQIIVICLGLWSCESVSENNSAQFSSTTKSINADTLTKTKTVRQISISTRQKLLNDISEVRPDLTLKIDTISNIGWTHEVLLKFLDSNQIIQPAIKINNKTFLEFKDQNSCDSAFNQIKNLAANIGEHNNLTTQEQMAILPKSGIAYFKLDNFLGFYMLSCSFTTRSYRELKNDLEQYDKTFDKADFFIVKCGATGTMFK